MLRERLKKIPNEPGVYIYKDSQGKVIYVGKAKALKRRVSSYFQKSHGDNPKIQLLVELIDSFDFIVTDTEFEALVLENTLIKRYQPVFNTSLRDDKTYPYLAITYSDDFPRVFVTRELHRKGTLYFGPYTQVRALRDTLDFLRSIFPIRTYARKRPTNPRAKPFMDYHIKWSLSGDMKRLDEASYREVINHVIDFLEGRDQTIVKTLEQDMKRASDEMEFERAARFRDRIVAARYLQEQQKVVSSERIDRDVIGLVDYDGHVYARVLFVRGGKLIGSRGFVVEKDQIENDALTSLIETYYNQADSIPEEVLLPHEIQDKEVIEAWLRTRRGRRVAILTPKRGEKLDLIKMAMANAKYAFEVYRINEVEKVERAETILEEMQRDLKLSGIPYRIECYDISTLQGNQSVGSMVVFENGRPSKRNYRKFKIKKVEGQDDFASMQEVLRRRLTHLIEPIPEGKFAARPDLLIVDGGKPQLSAAVKVLEELSLEIPVMALAKKEEELYVPGEKEPLVLSKRSPTLNLIRYIRDEAHRYAVTFHRALRSKQMLLSTFDTIPGVGSKRKKVLIEFFGTPEDIYHATLDQLKGVPGIPEVVAEDIYDYLHEGARSRELRAGIGRREE